MRLEKTDFYEWAFGNTLDNTTRAIIAEYLVHRAVGGVDRHRLNWNAFDIETPEGFTIEVKAAGLIQSWATEKQCVPEFDISIKNKLWLARENRYIPMTTRYSDIWVFAFHEETDRNLAEPLDTSQWRFLVTTSKWLEQNFGDQNKVRLSVLIKHGLTTVPYDRLRMNLLDKAKTISKSVIPVG
ncbi:MAG: hypothetical protein DBP02_08880 [gamma proteobacterium symbiont of Ctena orbiculata]|nr:MAG: hypothetical protein DBP02_08880 [gamma proteobacterium symbiont of Ctena orbiculata]